MSFILNDKNLLQQLLKLAQGALPAQPNASSRNPDQVRNIALKLINNLADNANDDGKSFTAEKSDANLSTKYLENLDNLLNFLQFNGIAIGGKKLVLSHAPKSGGAMQSGIGDSEFNMMDASSKAMYAKYPEEERDADDDDFQYYVYKDGIVKYLQNLQEQSAENTPRGRMLRLYVSNLQKEIEQHLKLTVPSASQKNIQTTPSNQAGNSNSQNGGQDNGAQNPYQNANYNKPNALTDEKGNLTEAGAKLMSDTPLPLVPNQIDLSRISTYASVMNRIRPQSQYTLLILQGIAKLQPYGVAVLPLHMDTFATIDAQIRANTNGAQSATGLLDLVQTILSNVKQMLMQAQQIIRTGPPARQREQLPPIEDQINNVYVDNYNGLGALKYQEQQVYRNISNQSRR